MQVNLLLIAFLLLIYSVGSFVLFIITSGGWAIFGQLYSVPLFVVTILIPIVGRFFRAGAYIPMESLWTYLKLMVITQIVALLLNVGNSGSGPSYYFYQTIWGRISGDYSGKVSNADITFIITRLAYHGVLIAFTIYIAFIAKRSGNS
ncbi:MAG: hypothetical protein EBE86_007660 [Hormoscilla sp. GUM202]|nr:hypothetical protein [Hormoscilla sp. GUM202]